jgi:uncharacterized protein YjbI with pentapeptide repeats/energy-coupling factor transporter ATP-binding protein EcfA2
MVQPQRAAVRPRVVSLETGDVVLLEDEVAVWLEGKSRTLKIVGGPGSGKTTALRHLAAVFGPRRDVVLIDDGGFASESDICDARRVIYSTANCPSEGDLPSMQLMSWSDDDLLEYCLACHRRQCSSIVERIRVMGAEPRLQGIPQLWTMLIDALAADEATSDWRMILVDQVTKTLSVATAARASEYCLATLLNFDTQALNALLRRKARALTRLPSLRHRAVQLLLSAARMVANLEGNQDPFFLAVRWPSDLVEETAAALSSSPVARRRLLDMIAGGSVNFHSTAATLLHAIGDGWQPPSPTRANLAGAVFTGSRWPDIDLSQAMLIDVDFSGADLSGARLNLIHGRGMKLRNANFSSAWFGGARMRAAQASRADLTDIRAAKSRWPQASFRASKLGGANLREADLRNADFTEADLTGGIFENARLMDAVFDLANCSGADFRAACLRRVRLSTAILADARFDDADLREADLEGLQWTDAALAWANLTRAYLTGSVMPRADLRGAVLCEAGLADVSWEDADLRDADFSNCAFHLGSSRSGLVFSPLACEGSRTGFYTDDFLEQDFKSPEEIRKADLRGADLRGADLRGAVVEQADFYLVDLRGAKYSAEQADHFRRCGAILVDRVRRT